MKHPSPRAGSTSGAHWEAAGNGKLLLPYCERCAAFRWPMRAACPKCDQPLGWREARGTGTIAAYSVVRRAAAPELKDAVPYIVAFVELDEGVRLFTNIVDAHAQEIRSGLRVECRFEPSTDAALGVPVFTASRKDR
jgi:uncharacterized OB-fold protein